MAPSDDEKYAEKGDVMHLDQPTSAEATQIRNDAMEAEEAELKMGLVEGLKTYPTAVFWSFAISLLIVMEGYDTAVLGNIIGLESFRQHFGYDTGKLDPPDQRYQLSAAWQTAVGQAPSIGCFFGIFIASWAQDRWGYKRTIQVALIALTGFIFINFFAVNVQMLFIGELLCGLPWGAFSSSAVSYASDVTPIPLRGYLTTYVNLCWIIGQMLAAGILRRATSLEGQWGYKVPFAVQWVWVVPLFIVAVVAPESPWFLVRKGRLEEAEAVVVRLSSKTRKIDPSKTVAMMVRTNQMEIEAEIGGTFLDCFKGTDLRRTEISCLTWMCQHLCGMVFCGNPVYFLQKAGLSVDKSFDANLGMTGMAFVGTLLSWITLTVGGRRPFFLGGMVFMSGIMWIIGGITWAADHHAGARWGQAALIMIFVFAYDFTIGPLTYCIVGETSATRLRSKTVGLARNAYNVIGVCAGILNTYMVNSEAWDWKGRAALFWAFTAVIMTVWAYFRLPEMKGRSYRELDLLFERKVPARQFKNTIISEEDDGGALNNVAAIPIDVNSGRKFSTANALHGDNKV
ncbi:hypothetical protein Q8F55_005457 [Vanrija albida]|uniref:Major facilitator superfamily (MFS) profile domain-containing protein n=1 Tax=Vanrija albida TaxID=181172 RepID=A0ABR3Q1P3_9TREE